MELPQNHSISLIQTVLRLRPIDDVLFEVLSQDIGFCEELLQTILQDKSLKVQEVIPQKSEKNLFGRSVRLDALCILGDGRKCNIEVQRSDADDHLRRIRYNAAMITSRSMEPGSRFEQVPTVMVIYITEKDFLKDGRTIYHIDNVVRETGRILDDGLSRILVNTAVDDGTEIAEYMSCMKQPEIPNERFPCLARRMREVKDVEGGQKAMCRIVEEYAAQIAEEHKDEWLAEGISKGRSQGHSQGLAEGKENVLCMLVAEGDISLEKGAEKLGRTPQQMREVMLARGYAMP